MTCEELLRALGDELDGEADSALRRELAAHLAGCEPCHVVLDNLRRTITLVRGESVRELSPALRTALESRLRARWDELHPGEPRGFLRRHADKLGFLAFVVVWSLLFSWLVPKLGVPT